MKIAIILLACFLLLFGLLGITNLRIEYSDFILRALAVVDAVAWAIVAIKMPRAG